MPKSLRFYPTTSLALLSLFWLAAVGRAEAAETITATAQMKTAGGVEATAPVTIVIDRFCSDKERDDVLAAVKQRSTQGARNLLLTWNGVGSVRVGGQINVIKYAYSRATADGRLITVVTGSPIAFVGAGVPGAQSKTGYDLGLVLLEIKKDGSSHGELMAATKVRLNEQNAIVTDGYSGDIVRLTKITAP
jgi:hypothetical protein